MSSIEFSPSFNQIKKEAALFATIDNSLETPRKIFEKLSEELLFPSYFGFNWNALLDCLRDFHWVSNRTIYILHESLPKLDLDDLKTYLEVLNEAASDWGRPDDEHILKVVFRESDRAKVEKFVT